MDYINLINALGTLPKPRFLQNPRENTVTDLLDPAVIKTAPYRGFDGTIWCYPPAPLTRLVTEGDVIDLGDRVFQTLHLPGHSPGSVGLWEAESGLLFTGDALYDGTLYDHLYHSVPEKLCDSLRRLRELPVSTVHAVITKVLTNFACILSLTNTFLDNAVCSALDQGRFKCTGHHQFLL